MRRHVVKIVGLGFIIAVAAVLLLVMIFRSWGGTGATEGVAATPASGPTAVPASVLPARPIPSPAPADTNVQGLIPASGAVVPETPTPHYSLADALHIISTAGFHGMCTEIRAAQSMARTDPRSLSRVRNALAVSQAASYPEALAEEVAAFEGSAQALISALNRDDVAAGLEACDTAHSAQHRLSHAYYVWLGEQYDEDGDGLLAAVIGAAGQDLSPSVQALLAAASVIAGLDVSAWMGVIFRVDSLGFHRMNQEVQVARRMTDVSPRNLGKVRYALAVTQAEAYPEALAEEVEAFQGAALALVDTLRAGDLAGAKEASEVFHNSLHRLSHATYEWLGEQQDEAIEGLLALVGTTAPPAISPSYAPIATATPTPTPTPLEPTPPATPATPEEEPVPPAAESPAEPPNIRVDGDTSDWSGLSPIPITLQQTEPIPGYDWGEVGPIDVDLRVTADSERIYVLVEVSDDYDYVPDDHGLSAAVAVMFRIDEPAAPHMGAREEDLDRSLGKVDIWHWELDCGPGNLSGGVTGTSGGNDPQCNLDDEYSRTPGDLEDDGSQQAENSLAGVWEHTARAQGTGAEGTWIFEMSRPLQTGDPDDAQLSLGATANLALAYWDADETPDGWTKAGHLQSASAGWIEVKLPTPAR